MKSGSFGLTRNFFKGALNAFLLGLQVPRSCEVKNSLKNSWFTPTIFIFSIFSGLLSIVSVRTARMYFFFSFFSSLLIPGVFWNFPHISFLSTSSHSSARVLDSPMPSNHFSWTSLRVIFPMVTSFSILDQTLLLLLRLFMPCFSRNFL